MYCTIVWEMYFWCKNGLGMHDFRVNGLVMILYVLAVILLSIDDGLGMAVFELAACFLWV